MRILDLGSGTKPYKREKAEIWHLDKFEFPHVEIVCDVENGLPFPSNYFDYVRASHLMEHLNDVVKVINEIWRVLKPNGKLQILTPHYTNTDFWRDPTHKRPFMIQSFDHFDPQTGWGKIAPMGKGKWKILSKKVLGENTDKAVVEVWMQPRKK